MMPIFRLPRLLPVTIAVLALVLVAKAEVLVRSAIDRGEPASVIAAARAAGPDAPAPSDKASQPGKAGQPEKVGQPEKAGAKPGQPAAPPPHAADIPPVPEGPAPMTDGEKAVLLDLRARREQLDARDAALANRESMAAAAEKKLSAQIGELQALQQRLEALDAGRKEQESAAWQGLVKVYEAMKPRDAATIFNDLGMSVLLSVIDRMKEAKAAAILAAMTPEKARDVTTQLALKRTGRAAAVESGDKPASVRAPGSGT
jgi:flagellar motility protein MotE (MotC chaperone)